MASIQDNNTILIYRVGPVLCCSPCMSVISITHPAPLTKLPGQQSHHSGIFKFGSSLVNVCELRKNFGVDPTEWRDPGRIIITELSTGHVGFWVDEILDVMESPESGWGNPPPLIPKATFSRTLTFNDEIHLYAEFDNLYAIKQIGYLKSYIEQLQKLNLSSAEITTEKKSTALNKNSVTNSDKTDSSPANQPRSNTEKLITSINNNSTTAVINETKNNANTKTTKNNLTEQLKFKPKKSNVSENQNTIKPNLTKNSNINTEKNKIQAKINKIEPDSKPRLKVKIPDKKNSSVIKTAELTTAAKTNAQAVKKSTKFESTPKVNNFKPAQSNTNFIDNTEDSDNFSGILLIGIALLLILLAGSFFYLQPDSAPHIEKYSLNTKFKKSVIVKPEKIITQTKIPTKDYTKPKNTTIQIDNNDNKTNTKKIEQPNNEQSNTQLIDKSGSGYSADITNDSDGITITVHTPVSTQQFESLKEKTSMVETTTEIKKIDNKISNDDKSETQQTNDEIDAQPKDILEEEPKDVKITIQVSNDQRSEKIAPSTITKEIIHIVVKGDTLWHIAKFYVDDPYRYPELARLSNIKNPDLIYPGNRVHIIQIFSDGRFLDDK